MTTSISQTWIGDGSDDNGTTCWNCKNGQVEVRNSKQGTPYNLRFGIPLESPYEPDGGDDLFSIEILELQGNLSFGLVALDEFQSGWKTRGMFYNGNITNGSAALRCGVGKHIASGDEVGVRISKASNNTTNHNELDVEFLVNGTSIGTAFRLGEEQGKKNFFPCVHIDGKARFVFRNKQGTVLKWATGGSKVDTTKTFEGDWKLESFSQGVKKIQLPPNHPIIISLRGRPFPTTIGIKVANTMNGSIKVTGQGTDPLGNPGSYKVQIGPLRSTMMMPPAELVEIEQLLSMELPNMAKMTVVLGEHLYIAGSGDFPSSEIFASRYTKRFEPMTKY